MAWHSNTHSFCFSFWSPFSGQPEPNDLLRLCLIRAATQERLSAAWGARAGGDVVKFGEADEGEGYQSDAPKRFTWPPMSDLSARQLRSYGYALGHWAASLKPSFP